MKCPICQTKMRFKKLIPYREGQPQFKADYRCDGCGVWMWLISTEIDKIKPRGE